MVVIRASINERGLDFTNQQKVVILRDKNKHLKNGEEADVVEQDSRTG